MQLTTTMGGQAVDERGVLSYVQLPDGFVPKRFYWISNHQAQFVRAWHGHRLESKLITCIAGAVLLGLVQPNDWERPDPGCSWVTTVLSAARPQSPLIAPGYAHGWMSLTADTILLVLSDKTAEESRADDYRFAARLWDPWQVLER